jgi:hypothetical protein
MLSHNPLASINFNRFNIDGWAGRAVEQQCEIDVYVMAFSNHPLQVRHGHSRHQLSQQRLILLFMHDDDQRI